MASSSSVPVKEKKLMEVKLGELPGWILMRDFIPKGIAGAFQKEVTGHPRWLSGLALPSAWGEILETWDQVPYQAPCTETASPSACVSASLSLSL
ncbi:ATP synthase subunit f, mitochondrial [Vulpes lagopus]